MLCDKLHSCPDRKKFSCSDQESHPSLPSCLRVSGEHHVHVARRHVLKRTELLGMSSLESHYVATAVCEVANNLFFHTKQGGVIQFSHIEDHGSHGIEIVAIDDGCGIEDIQQAMADGFSTNGGLGGGLGGMQRLMDEFEIESKPGEGTRIVMRKWVAVPLI